MACAWVEAAEVGKGTDFRNAWGLNQQDLMLNEMWECKEEDAFKHFQAQGGEWFIGTEGLKGTQCGWSPV